jgi:hypothetical protein
MNNRKKLVINYFVLATSLLINFSCTIYHIEFPQPIDVKNLYSFPKSMRGTWVNSDGKSPHDNWVIKKNELLCGTNAPKIYNGIVDSVGKWKGQGLKHIEYDNQKNAIDTVSDYILKNNRLYKWQDKDDNGKRFLSPGFPVALKNDTLYVLPKNNFNLTFLSLGPEAFLRQISANQFILNIKEESLIKSAFKSDGQTWWQMVLLELTSDGQLQVSSFNFNKMVDETNVVDSNENYLSFEWTRQDIINRIRDKNYSLEPLLNLKRKTIEK